MRISVRVKPRSSRNKVEQLPDGSFCVWLSASPVEGKANEALIKALSDYFDKPKSEITIISGHTSKNKIVEV